MEFSKDDNYSKYPRVVKYSSYLIIQDPMRHLRSPNKLVIYYLRI